MKQTGKTTRKVDNAIQDFFNNGIAYLYEGRSEKPTEHMEALGTFTNRMKNEHPNSKFTYEYGCFEGVWCYKITTHNL